MAQAVCVISSVKVPERVKMTNFQKRFHLGWSDCREKETDYHIWFVIGFALVALAIALILCLKYEIGVLYPNSL